MAVCFGADISKQAVRSSIKWRRFFLTQGEKILLVLTGGFAVAPLLMLMFAPQNGYFKIPDALQIAIYACIGVFFLLFVKFRKNMRLALTFMWILCGFFLLSIVLVALASGALS